MTRLANKPSPTRIGDLRAGLRAAREKPAFERAPPKPKKRQPKGDTAEDRAEKAERQAQAQHTTSLLAGGNSKKRYVRVGERPEKKGTALGFLFQLVLVMGVAGAAAYIIDPTIMPQEWTAQAHEWTDQAHDLIETWL